MSKNNSEAVKFLLQGNFLYEKGRHCEALLSYNRSLCLAESATQIASVCYGKRSLVYFDLKEYELCLANIELAKQHSTGEVVKFDDLKSQCFERMKTHRHAVDEDPMNFFQLTYPANAKLPCLSDCLELRVNKKFGRHIISTRNLNVGDIVAVTEFSFIFFDKRARLHHCSHCTKSSTKLNLIPCSGCAKAMYCSTECMTKDKNKFHQYECGINDNPEDQHIDFNPLKIFVHILDQFDGNVAEMKKFLDANRKPKTVFDFDFSNKDDPMFEKNMILATLSMSHAMNCAEMGRFHCLTTHHRFIVKHPKLLSLWMSPQKQYLDELLCKFLDVEDVKGLVSCFVEIDINLKEDGYDLIDAKTDTATKVDNTYINRVASVIDPYLSLLNQSCFPNVSVKFVNNKHVWIVIRPVKAGEQLFMFRGPGIKYVTPRVQRQQMMLEYFGFRCDCDGCVNNWPTQQKMKRLNDSERLALSFEKLQLNPAIDESQSKAYAEYVNFATKIQAMAKHYPCWDSILLEHNWMFNIYRLAQPAKWFNSNESVAGASK
ncbi:hypothetical protein HA402_016035 [Bradysia odoriphaga]|nr:hypothetical protein HA402_016035 [Bradysia odoriphaga]